MNSVTSFNPEVLNHADLSAVSVLAIGLDPFAFVKAYQSRNPMADMNCVQHKPGGVSLVRHAEIGGLSADLASKDQLEQLKDGLGLKRFDLIVVQGTLSANIDPITVLQAVAPLLAATGQVRLAFPNSMHWSQLANRLAGGRPSEDGKGPGFHTKQTAENAITAAGWNVRRRVDWIVKHENSRKIADMIGEIDARPSDERKAIERTINTAEWVFCVSKDKQPKPLNIQAYGMKTQHDAMVKVRLSNPLIALNSTGRVRASLAIGADGSHQPRDADIMWFYRTHLGSPDRAPDFVRRGGLLLLDIDDHPQFLPNHTKSNFLTIKGVHAVTVTNDKLAAVIKQWNPEVHVIENAVLDLPKARANWGLAQDPRIHLVFAALNRTDDWKAQCAEMISFLTKNGNQFRATVLHDKAVFEDLSPIVDTTFIPLAPYNDYLKLLRTAHVVLMPLRETTFNRVKSDLKVTETLAAGAVPLMSAAAFDLTDTPQDHVIVCETPDDWAQSLQAIAANPGRFFEQAQRGRDYIKTTGMIAGQIDRRMQLFQTLLQKQPDLEQARQARLTAWKLEQG